MFMDELKGDDWESAPGFQDRASTGEYHSSVQPLDERYASGPVLSVSGVNKYRSKKASRVEEESILLCSRAVGKMSVRRNTRYLYSAAPLLKVLL